MPAAEVAEHHGPATPFFIRRDGQVCRAVDVIVALTAPAAE